MWIDNTDKSGFDVVVGNPPYVNTRELSNHYPESKKLFPIFYESASGLYDILVIFIERGLHLLIEKGYFSFIVSNWFMATDYRYKTRKILLETTMLRLFTDVSSAKVFRNVGIYPIIVAFQKETSVYSNKVVVEKLKVSDKLGCNRGFVKQEYFLNQPNIVFVIEEADIEKLLHRIENNTQPLKKLCNLHSGTTGFEYKNWGIYNKECCVV